MQFGGVVKDEEIFCYDSIKTEILMNELQNNSTAS
jgi:hypothetical protein